MSELSPNATLCERARIAIAAGPELLSPLHPDAIKFGKKHESARDFAERVALLAVSATIVEDDIKRFRVGDILFNDEQARMFCDLALKGLRAEARRPVSVDAYALYAAAFHALFGEETPVGTDLSPAALQEMADTLLCAPSATTFTWIPVAERLPEEDTNVMFVTRRNVGYVWIGWRSESGGWFDHYDDNKISAGEDVTHWMPLPEAPK